MENKTAEMIRGWFEAESNGSAGERGERVAKFLARMPGLRVSLREARALVFEAVTGRTFFERSTIKPGDFKASMDWHAAGR